MKFRDILIALGSLVLVAVFFTFARAARAAPAASEAAPFGKPDIVEVMELSGEIDQSTATAVKTQVEKINENPKIKAVLLVVNSPGGGASASAVIYRELSRIKVPVVGYCEYMCASGGVYALMATSVKFIGVSDETIGGSVGVIMHLTRYYRLLDWAKIDNETYKSGVMKDFGNPTRAPSEAERKDLQGTVDTLAQKFYAVVHKGRGAKVDGHWPELKSAGVFFGEGIVKVGLADAVMTRDEAIAKAKELSGSKLAFTREELGKMSKAAQESTSYKAPVAADGAGDAMLGDLHFLVGLVREARSGETIRFEYRAPYTF